MPELTEKQIEKLEETHETVIKLATDFDWLKEEVNSIETNHHELCANHNTLKRNFWGLVCFLVGSGILSGGAYGLLKLVK